MQSRPRVGGGGGGGQLPPLLLHHCIMIPKLISTHLPLSGPVCHKLITLSMQNQAFQHSPAIFKCNLMFELGGSIATCLVVKMKFISRMVNSSRASSTVRMWVEQE